MTTDQPNSELARAQAAFTLEGYDGPLQVERIFRLEGDFDPTKLERLMANPAAGETLTRIDDPESLFTADSVEVAYRPAVIDPETIYGLEAAEKMGVKGLEYIRLSHRYIAPGLSRGEIERITRKYLCNHVVQIIISKNDYAQTLRPTGQPEPLKWYDFTGLSDEELVELSRSASWYAPLEQMLAMRDRQVINGRKWRDGEVEKVFQSWSDHCFHTSWKQLGLMKYLMAATHKIDHPLCKGLPVFIDNSGPMLFYDDYVLYIKFESHNHPTSIYPKGGIETKHGGLFRDLMEMGLGGYPLCGATIMGTGRPSIAYDQVPKGALHPKTIVRESIAGTASYCNPMGIPMAYTDYQERPQYGGKCWALGGGIGFTTLKAIFKGQPKEGDDLILGGGWTGRDGVHGATASSGDLTSKMVVKEGASVQIGHPIIERQTATAIQFMRDLGLIIWITDLGAGGISCASAETVANCGADLDITNLPVKSHDLASWEKLLSESQERFLIVSDPKNTQAVLDILRRYGITAFKLGKCRGDKRLIVLDHGETVVDMDLDFLWEGCPIGTSTTKDPEIKRLIIQPQPANIISANLLTKIAGDYACADQSYATTQFDNTVQGRTVVGPLINGVPSDAFVCTPLYDKPYGAVMTVAYNARQSEVDPVGSIGCLMSLAISKAIAIGVAPNDAVFCGNYYTPTRTPEQRWYLSQMVHRAADLSCVFGIPFVSGKDSSKGSYIDEDGNVIDVPLTFVPSILGRMPDVSRVIDKTFKGHHSLILIRPHCKPSMAGSVMLDILDNDPKEAKLAWPDSEKEMMALWQTIHDKRDLFESIAAIGRGGVFLQILHGIVSSGFGVELSLNSELATWNLLGECPSSFLISTASPCIVQTAFSQFDCIQIGNTASQSGLEISIDNRVVVESKDWSVVLDSWKTGFKKELGV
jgi:phosphoribosylformylglycinamidine synthase